MYRVKIIIENEKNDELINRLFTIEDFTGVTSDVMQENMAKALEDAELNDNVDWDNERNMELEADHEDEL